MVQELLVAKGGPLPVSNLAELAAWSAKAPSNAVTVRPSSSYRETLNALKVRVALSGEDVDESDLVRAVVAGKIPFSACDSDLFADIAAFMPEAIAAPFPLAEGRQVALGVRPTNPQLKAAADAFLIQHAMTGHKSDTDVGDLDAAKKRGSIRVLLRNNATNYFIYRGVQQGFEYELLKMYAKESDLRIDVIVPFENGDVIPWLRAGRGDVAATEMTATDERKAQLAFTQPYMFVDEVLIQKNGAPPIKTVDQLKTAVTSGALALHVRKSSSYAATLDALGIAHVDAPEDIETEQLIGRVASGEIPATIADSSIATVETKAHKGAQLTLVLKKKNPIALGVRTDNKQLLANLDAFLKKHARNGDVERLRRKYFAARPGWSAGQVDIRVTGVLSPFDPQIKKWARSYGLDWRLLAAQAYQESAFDPKAESWCGAQGLFQVMPKTGRELGFADVGKPEHNIHAGIMYMAQLIDALDPRLPFKQRVRFALASYNAGPHHLADARVLAAELGLDPDKWFGNVEKAMLLLEQSKYARRAKHGWCRGSEPVNYVSSIQSRYDNWTSVLPDDTAPRR